MASGISKTPTPSDEQLQDAFLTISGLPLPNDQLGVRLHKLDDIIRKAGPLPREPLLLSEESDNSVRHVVVGNELIVGRQPGLGGLMIADDNSLGRRHFAVRNAGEYHIIQDLQSRNGTALNQTHNRIQECVLRDGDLIFAGSRIFAFLYQRNAA